MSSYNDSGAAWIEFVAATDDTALIELTHQKMRVWINDELLGRPKVDTTVSLSDTGWENTSTGGVLVTPSVDVIPAMTSAASTAAAIVTASSQNILEPDDIEIGTWSAWQAADNAANRGWADTGFGKATLPSWWNINFDTGGNDTGRRQAVTSYSINPTGSLSVQPYAPRAWRLLTGNHDTGTFATDTGKWTLEDERTAEVDWALGEKRVYEIAAVDTGTIEARRHWRLHFTARDTGAGLSAANPIIVTEIEMFTDGSASQVKAAGGTRVFNASSIGGIAKLQKRVVVDTGDLDVEHSLNINITRGPIGLRCGSTAGDDDYIRETTLGTGYHNLAFTPSGNFHITLQSTAIVDRILGSLLPGDSGAIELGGR